LEGEQHAELPVVLEAGLVAASASRIEVRAPAGRDEVDRSVFGDVPVTSAFMAWRSTTASRISPGDTLVAKVRADSTCGAKERTWEKQASISSTPAPAARATKSGSVNAGALGSPGWGEPWR